MFGTHLHETVDLDYKVLVIGSVSINVYVWTRFSHQLNCSIIFNLLEEGTGFGSLHIMTTWISSELELYRGRSSLFLCVEIILTLKANLQMLWEISVIAQS